MLLVTFFQGMAWLGPHRARRTIDPSDFIYILQGAAEAAFYCAHRTIYMFSPSLLVISLGMGAD